MEEAVTRKFVHEESSTVTSLCGAVEACLSDGLKRRALGLFKTSSTTALLHKIGKTFEPAAIISNKVLEAEQQADISRKSSSSGDSTNRGAISKSFSFQKKPSVSPSPLPRYLWIRFALFERQLEKIIDYLVQNSSKFYEKNALVSDPDYGSILSSLLVGPCALEYSKAKTQDHFWTDPPADELVQRHRISSGNPTPPSCRRNVLNIRRSLNATASDDSYRNIPMTAKDYVESLHQNSRDTLLYGKNNVNVVPKDVEETMPGYLSLHQSAKSLTIKWTPNNLMNGYTDPDMPDKRRSSFPGFQPQSRRHYRRFSSHIGSETYVYWEYALNVKVDEIVYVHCHQRVADSGGTLVLVGQDGVQHPPIHFPKGGHILAFLSCLENGLLPHGQLDPPLWSQRGKGKVFPKLRRKGRTLPDMSPEERNDDEPADYVFRIITNTKQEDFLAGKEMMESNRQTCGHVQIKSRAYLMSSSTASSTSSSKSLSQEPPSGTDVAPESPRMASGDQPHRLTSEDSIQLACETMKKQIISRAFYGWLAYCRHLTTVRTHLSGLVNVEIIPADEPVDASEGLSQAKWNELHKDGVLEDRAEVFRLTYFGGVCPELRKEAWPYLLGHYQFGSTSQEREEQDYQMRQNYETTMSEWLAVEAIVRQRDKEALAANIAKLSSESTSGDVPPATPALAQELSNEVFDDNMSIISDYNGIIEEEDSSLTDDGNEKQDESEKQIVEEMEIDSGSEVKKEEHSVQKGEDNVDTCEAACDTNHHNYSTSETTDLCNKHEKEKKGKKSSSPDEGVVTDDYTETREKKEKKTRKNEFQLPLTDSSVKTSTAVIVTTNPSVDSGHQSDHVEELGYNLTPPEEEKEVIDTLGVDSTTEGDSQCSRSTCISPASSHGGVYSPELLDKFALNLHRIDKDVQRCDRNYWYFTTENLEKLRNVMCTYVWEHLETGYMQGMCDLVAPLLVVFDDEGMTYSCFTNYMDRMSMNFPCGGAMDTHFANMRSLIQILDSEMFELMHQNGDYTHFYFCYRWFLLDFKRELVYDDVFSVWECIWAAAVVSSQHFVLFIALALVESYRDIILSNSMDFTDIIKFFNEMAEHHEAKSVLALARDLVLQVQILMENK